MACIYLAGVIQQELVNGGDTATLSPALSQGRGRTSRGFLLLHLRLLEGERARLHVDVDRVLGREPALEDRFRERVLDLLLDRALERPRPVDRIEPRLRQLAH